MRPIIVLLISLIVVTAILIIYFVTGGSTALKARFGGTSVPGVPARPPGIAARLRTAADFLREAEEAPALPPAAQTRRLEALRRRAREQYTAALGEARAGRGAAPALPPTVRRAVAQAPRVALGDTELHLLDPMVALLMIAADEFAHAAADDPVVAHFMFPFGQPPAVRMPTFEMIDMDIATQTGLLRDTVMATRRKVADEIAAEQGGARGAAVDTYLDLAAQHTDDPQNVHDTGVLACLRAIVDRLRAEQGSLDALASLDSIEAELKALDSAAAPLSALTPGGRARPEATAAVLAVLQKARAGERVTKLDATDGECLRRVWARADHPGNSRPRLRQALFDALHDAWEPDPLVAGQKKIACVNGRAGRILGSLALNDFDKRNWVVKRLEQFKNDVFERARGVVDAEALRAATEGAPDEQKAGRAYLAKTAEEMRAVGAVPDAAAAQLAERIRARSGRWSTATSKRSRPSTASRARSPTTWSSR